MATASQVEAEKLDLFAAASRRKNASTASIFTAAMLVTPLAAIVRNSFDDVAIVPTVILSLLAWVGCLSYSPTLVLPWARALSDSNPERVHDEHLP